MEYMAVLFQGVDGMMHPAQGFFLAKECSEFVHIRSLSLANEAYAPCIPWA